MTAQGRLWKRWLLIREAEGKRVGLRGGGGGGDAAGLWSGSGGGRSSQDAPCLAFSTRPCAPSSTQMAEWLWVGPLTLGPSFCCL